MNLYPVSDRDRDPGPEFDWTPETIHLSEAARLIIAASRTHNGPHRAFAYAGMMALWQALTDLDQAEALVYAAQIANLHPPAKAAPIPF